jgi:hypothetical protein
MVHGIGAAVNRIYARGYPFRDGMWIRPPLSKLGKKRPFKHYRVPEGLRQLFQQRTWHKKIQILKNE